LIVMGISNVTLLQQRSLNAHTINTHSNVPGVDGR
jgi:hypothetical protein